MKQRGLQSWPKAHPLGDQKRWASLGVSYQVYWGGVYQIYGIHHESMCCSCTKTMLIFSILFQF